MNAALLPWFGGACCLAAIAALLWAFLPRRTDVPLERRRPGVVAPPSALARLSAMTSAGVGRLIGTRGGGLEAVLERAGVRLAARDYVIVVGAASLLGFAALLLLGHPIIGLLLALLVPVLARIVLSFRADRRRARFAGQLDESLQMLASSLRAGYSLLQAVQAVATEAEQPTRDEFTRVVNETRVGRSVADALTDAANRMKNEDFFWVGQAIAINREVGGNLADVLDGVARTIRQRGSLRRQVNALAAEGKLSAYILFGLPFVVGTMVALLNPTYLSPLISTLPGFLLLGVGAVLLVAGGLWLRATVRIKF